MIIAVTAAVATAAAAVALSQFLSLPPYFDSNPSEVRQDEVMKAVSYSRHGDTSVLEFRTDYPQPALREGQVLIEVKASSINPCDFKFRRSASPGFVTPLPKIPGEDVAGVVAEVYPSASANSRRFRVGDRVAAMLPTLGTRWGSAAEYVAVNENLVAKMGDTTSFEEAASVPLVSLTAIQALSKLGRKSGSAAKEKDAGGKILIHAGAGGVGTFAVQYAKKVLKMQVATTASGAKEDFVRELGADVVVDYRTRKFEDSVRDYDAVLDTMSWSYEGRTLSKGSRVLKSNGHYLNVLSSSWSFVGGKEESNGPLTAKNMLYSKLWNFLRPGSVPRYDVVIVNPNGEELQRVLDLLENRTILATIDRRYPLAEAAAAYDYLEKGHASGKIILVH